MTYQSLYLNPQQDWAVDGLLKQPAPELTTKASFQANATEAHLAD